MLPFQIAAWMYIQIEMILECGIANTKSYGRKIREEWMLFRRKHKILSNEQISSFRYLATQNTKNILVRRQTIYDYHTRTNKKRNCTATCDNNQNWLENRNWLIPVNFLFYCGDRCGATVWRSIVCVCECAVHTLACKILFFFCSQICAFDINFFSRIYCCGF